MSDEILPTVSCICPTYNRAPNYLHLLEEAIESFLRQDYPHKELIVINDTPDQEIFYDHPQVFITNTPKRFRTLGEKRNAAVAMSTGSLLTLWDDDDISMPWRLSYSVKRLGDADYFNPRAYWMFYGGKILYDHNLGNCHNCSLYRREMFYLASGYQMISLGDDQQMDSFLIRKATSGVDSAYRGTEPLPRKDWFYLYRFGVSPGHVSAGGVPEHGLYNDVGKRAIAKGCFQLRPHWRSDYVADIEYADANPEESCERCVDL